MNLVTVHKITQTAYPCSYIRWDEEGSSVSCELKYSIPPVNEECNRTLREKIDQQFNIKPQNYLITGGMFSMALDSQKRVKDWDIYTNPAQWTEYTLPYAETLPATLIIEAEFDKNGHTEDIGEPEIYYEPQRGTLYLIWDDVSVWYAIAPCLAIGVTKRNHLAQIRLDGLFVSRIMKETTGRCARLLRRFGIGRR